MKDIYSERELVAAISNVPPEAVANRLQVSPPVEHLMQILFPAKVIRIHELVWDAEMLSSMNGLEEKKAASSSCYGKSFPEPRNLLTF